MLDKPTQDEIVTATQKLWDSRAKAGDLAQYMLRKERGHGLADWVEDVTVEMLESEFGTRVAYEHKGGERRRRSMGDLWIESGGIYNPVNIKTGVKEPGEPSSGQPNLVSLAKLTHAVLRRWIDSYYLLFIHFTAAEPVAVKVALADLLHIAEGYTHFDSGTGQLMLKAGRYDNPPPPDYTAVDPGVALKHLQHVREDGNRRLQTTREKALERVKQEMMDFDESEPIDQTELHLDSAS